MSWKAHAWAKLQNIPRHRRATLRELADMHSATTGRCDPFVPTLMRRAERSERSVQSDVSYYEGLGLVTRHLRAGRSTQYELNLLVVVAERPGREAAKRRPRRPRPVQFDLFAWADAREILHPGPHPEVPNPAPITFLSSGDPGPVLRTAFAAPESANDNSAEAAAPAPPTPPAPEAAQVVQPAAEVVAPAPTAPLRQRDARDILWGDGLDALARMTGKPRNSCRSLLGRLLRDMRDDCAALLDLLRETEADRRIAPVDFLVAAARRRGGKMKHGAMMASAIASILADVDAWERPAIEDGRESA
jgi:hypothetical protein